MPVVETRIATERARRYLGQLCKHFAIKVPVELAADLSRGHVRFVVDGREIGSAVLGADALELRVRAEAADEAASRQVRAILEAHIRQFAWREKPPVAWTPADG